MKLLFFFEKGESVRWLGHLDVLRTFERAIRRAGLPVAFTSGFNPREKLAFASALGVGVMALREPATLELSERMEARDAMDRLNAMLPPGLRLLSVQEIPIAGSRDLLNSFNEAEYDLLCEGDVAAPDRIQGAIDATLGAASLPYRRLRDGQVRHVDLRPFLRSLSLIEATDGRVRLNIGLSVGNAGSARPSEIVDLLHERGPELAIRRVTRTRLLQTGGSGETERIVERDTG